MSFSISPFSSSLPLPYYRSIPLFPSPPKPLPPASPPGDLPAEYLASPLSKQQQKPAAKTEEEMKEEEELQLALAISQSEAEKGNKKKTSDDADLELAIAMSKKEHEKSEKKGGNPVTAAAPSAAPLATVAAAAPVTIGRKEGRNRPSAPSQGA